LSEELSNPDLYANGNDKAQTVQDELAKIEEDLLKLFERWETLEAKVS